MAEQRQKIIRNRVALAAEESVSGVTGAIAPSHQEDPPMRIYIIGNDGITRHGRTPDQISARLPNIRGAADHTFPGEQFHAQSWPNNAITLSGREWLWSAKRA
jgi:hypothetical protein